MDYDQDRPESCVIDLELFSVISLLGRAPMVKASGCNQWLMLRCGFHSENCLYRMLKYFLLNCSYMEGRCVCKVMT